MITSARALAFTLQVVEVLPTSKCDKIRAAWAAGDLIGALRIAARFFDRQRQPKLSSAAWMRTTILGSIGNLGRTLTCC